MKCEDEDYTRQVLVLILIIIGIWAVGAWVLSATAQHSVFDYDVGIDTFVGENVNGIIKLDGTVTNYGNEHLEFVYTIYLNDKFLAEQTYMLGVGSYIIINYNYDATQLGYGVQMFDAEVWSELDQNYDNDLKSAYVISGKAV